MKIRDGVHQRSTSAASVKALYLSLIRQANGVTPSSSGSPVLIDLDAGDPAPNVSVDLSAVSGILSRFSSTC